MIEFTTCDKGREAIERLRVRVPQRDTPIQLHQALRLVEMVQEGWCSIDAVCAETGLARKDVFDTVVDLGTWLGQSVNAGAKVKAVEYSAAVGDDRAMVGEGNQLSLFPGHTEDCVVVPPGFDRRSAGRDLSKAIAQLVRARPDEAMLRRWLMRRYHTIRQVLSFEIVAMVHRICQIDRLGEIDQLAERGSFNHEFARILVEAYDLQDIARADAVAAANRILAVTSEDDVCIERLADDVAVASWLHEAEFARVSRALETGRPAVVLRALDELRRAASHAPATFGPRGVTELSDGQVQRLAEREGIRTDGTTGREADVVRAWVQEAGMQSDADLLVPDGMRAERAGLGEVFREALARRAEGDLDWSDELNEALAEVARV